MEVTLKRESPARQAPDSAFMSIWGNPPCLCHHLSRLASCWPKVIDCR